MLIEAGVSVGGAASCIDPGNSPSLSGIEPKADLGIPGLAGGQRAPARACFGSRSMHQVFSAHSEQLLDRSEWQGLAEHLAAVARLAVENANLFGAAEMGTGGGPAARSRQEFRRLPAAARRQRPARTCDGCAEVAVERCYGSGMAPRSEVSRVNGLGARFATFVEGFRHEKL